MESYNEWDPLEEVIVGVVDGATVPPWDSITKATMPASAASFFTEYGGKPFPAKMIDEASQELEGLCALLNELGIKVRRPAPMDFSIEYTTPWWKSRGLYAAMPRDVLIVIGKTIVEAAMAWRTRYFESLSYNALLLDYFAQGAGWIPAPASSMDEKFYNQTYDPNKPYIDGKRQYPITNREVAFDAADFVRCGKDIFVQKSHVTNDLGIQWVRRHAGAEYTLHEVEFSDAHPMHIDTTIIPLAPGKILINPEWVNESDLSPQFKSWDILVAPHPAKPLDLYFSSNWLSINLLSIDAKRIIVEQEEQPLIAALKKWGFEPIPIPFRAYYPFGGSVHCATLDIRRRGELESYF